MKLRVDLIEYENQKMRKMAFCLTFNSIILDLKEQHAKSNSMDDAVEICLKRLARHAYQLNFEVVNQETQRKFNKPLAANENYGNKQHWMD